MKTQPRLADHHLATVYPNLALVERLLNGWALLQEREDCWIAIGPIDPKRGEIGAQVGTFPRNDQSAKFKALPINSASTDALVAAMIAKFP